MCANRRLTAIDWSDQSNISLRDYQMFISKLAKSFFIYTSNDGSNFSAPWQI